MLIQTIFSGIVLGLTLAIMLGPAFFALLQTSIDKGFRSAFQFAVGICVSDAFVIAIVFLGVSSFMEKPAIGHIIGLVGGGMLIGMGIHTLLCRCKERGTKLEAEKDIEKHAERYENSKLNSFYLRGFLLNLANPAVWFFWIFSVGLVSSQYINPKGGPDIFYLTVFFACTLGTVILTDILKAFGAHSLKSKINEVLLRKINMIFAVVLVGFGIFLVARSGYPILELMLKYYSYK
ncbi:MAG: LysE family transporter [Bacteroidales bacterium]|nr:LysE family transporter [Bacteroidales bacterium]